MRQHKFKGLFFPYATIQSQSVLNTAALYFDEIAIIDPTATLSNLDDTIKSHTRAGESYIERIKPLIDEGIVKLMDPSRVISNYGDAIVEGVLEDVFNRDFLSICEPNADSAWTISARKLPKPLDDWQKNLLVHMPDLLADQVLPEMFGGSGYVDFVYQEVCYESPINYDPKAAKEFYRSNVKDEGYKVPEELGSGFTRPASMLPGRGPKRVEPEIEDSRDIETRSVTLPFVLGEAIMLAHSLAIASNEGYVPFTNEKTHFDALAWKMKSAAKRPGVAELLKDYGYLKDVKAGHMGLSIIETTIPSLEDVPIDTLLKFRSTREEELEHFRVEVAKLVSSIDANVWDDDFAKHVSDVVDTKIVPAIKDVERQMKTSKEKLLARAVKSIASAGPLPFVASVWGGLPLYVAVAIGGGLAALTLALDSIVETRSVKRNGLALLMEAGKLA